MMFAENGRVLSRVTPRFFAFCGQRHRGVVKRDGEVLERAGLPREEEQLCLVRVALEVVGRHPN